jgi:hypothetical protein
LVGLALIRVSLSFDIGLNVRIHLARSLDRVTLPWFDRAGSFIAADLDGVISVWTPFNVYFWHIDFLLF